MSMKTTVLLIGTAFAISAPEALARQEAVTLAGEMQQEQDAYTRFFQLANAYFHANLALNPLDAASSGVHDFDDRFGDYLSDGYLRQQKSLEQKYLLLAQALPKETLTREQQLQLESFIYSRQIALKGFDFPFWYFPATQEVNPAAILASQASGNMSQPFESVADYDAFLRKINGFEEWVRLAIERMNEGVAKGYALPRPVADATAEQMRSYVSARAEESLFWAPIRALPEHFTEEERQRLTRSYREAIDKIVNPAYQRYADFLTRDYKARATLGWVDLPNGAAWYQYIVEQQTTIGIPYDTLYVRGQKDVARIVREMDRIRVRVGFKGDLKAFWKALLEEPQYKFDTPEMIFADQQRIQRAMEQVALQFFNRTPNTPMVLKAIPKAREESDGTLWYQAGSADGREPGIYWVNTRPDMALYRWESESNFLHEAIPGHHFQISLKQEQKGVPEFMKYSNFNGFEEGWALYVESISTEMGFAKDPLQDFGRLNNEMLRTLRLVVEPGLQAKGWSMEKARQYMLEHSALTPEYVDYEVLRYLANPGQALSYNVGKDTIRALRQEAETALGERFDVRRFHEQVIGSGTIPLASLQYKIRGWIETQKEPTVSAR